MKADTHTLDFTYEHAHVRIDAYGRTDTREIKGFEYVCIDYFKLLALPPSDLQCF